MRAFVLGASLLLSGCHSGTLGAAGISASVSLVGIANQDMLDFLKVNRTPTAVTMPASGATP